MVALRTSARVLSALLFVSSAAATITLQPRIAHADDDPVTIEARKRFEEGVKLYDAKKYEAARAAFAQAYALKKHPAVLLNLAHAELQSGHPLEAAQHFRDYLQSGPKDDNKKADAERGLADARAKLGRLQVTADVADSEVYVDGNKVAVTPLQEPIDVTPGPHNVEVKKGSQSEKKSVTAPEGKITMVDFSLGKGTPAVTSTPDKKDDKKKPEPTASTTSPTGGREPFMHWATHSPVAFAGEGLAGVGLILGVTFSITAAVADNNAASVSNQIKGRISGEAASGNPIAQARQTNPCAQPPANTGVSGTDYAKACSQLQDNIDSRDTSRTVSIIGWVATGVGVGAVVGGYFLTAKKTEQTAWTRMKVLPVYTPEWHGLAAGTTFLGTSGKYHCRSFAPLRNASSLSLSTPFASFRNRG